MDTVRSFVGTVADRSSQQLHDGWIHSPVAGSGSDRSGVPIDHGTKNGCLSQILKAADQPIIA